jgi:ABC-type Fe3+/spermidine/putrescine transport system ATPase subunit
VGKLLEMVNLSGEKNSFPHELSGGERQRVALARALVADPKVLLMDEPMANLDEGLKRELLVSVRDLQKEFHVTMIYVTHDQREALAVGEILAIMEGGRIHQSGPPLDLYYEPRDGFVARFLGRNNILTGEVSQGLFVCPAGSFPLEGETPGGPVSVALRAEDISLALEPDGPLVVESCSFQGGRYFVQCTTGKIELTAEVTEALSPGDKVAARAKRPAYAVPAP